ncbi:hypothetical protein D3C81_1743470 [compost metagenome]
MHHLIGEQALWLGIAEHDMACQFVVFALWPHQAEACTDQRQAFASHANEGAGGHIAAGAGAGHHAGV